MKTGHDSTASGLTEIFHTSLQPKNVRFYDILIRDKKCYSSWANPGMEGLYNRIYELIATRWLIWMQAEGAMSLTWPGIVCARITVHTNSSISYTLNKSGK